MARTFRRGRRPASSRRKLVWNRLIFQTTLTQANPGFTANCLEPLQTDIGAQLLGCTVMRIRGRVNWQTIGSNVNQVVGAIGVRPITDDSLPFGAVALANIASGPAHIPGRHMDWMMYEPVSIPEGNWQDINIDTRARRKVDELGDGIMFYADAGTLAGTDTVKVAGVLSFLIALA